MEENKQYKKICLVVPYFGKWPNYFPFFLESCKFNPSIDWLFYTNCEIPKNPPSNTKFIPATMDDFNALASQKTGLSIHIIYPYKLCDFKPTYGHLFEDYLAGYDFWGYSDIDLILGNMRHFLTDEILSSHDIITTYDNFLAGPLTIFKNDETTKFIYKKNADYKKVLESEEYFDFDETHFIFDKNFFQPDFFQPQSQKIKSMSSSVAQLVKRGSMKLYAKPLAYNLDIASRDIIEFCRGTLLTDHQKEIFLVHLLLIKMSDKIFLPKFNQSRESFFVSRYGIYYGNPPSWLQRMFITLVVKINSYAKLKIGLFLQKVAPKLYYFLKKKRT